MESSSSLPTLFALLVLPLLVHGFRVPSPIGKSGSVAFVPQRQQQQQLLQQQRRRHSVASPHRIRSLAGKNDDDADDEMKLGPGMEDAFRELEALKSLGNENLPERPEGGKAVTKDEAFASAMDSLNLQDILSEAEAENEAADLSPESEVELYKDMASELEVASSEEDLIAADFKNDLELAESSEAGVPVIDTQKFMDRAINEALREAKDQDSSVDIDDAKEAFLDNKEIMSEIEKIFDKANDDLLEELEEIRVEQVRAL